MGTSSIDHTTDSTKVSSDAVKDSPPADDNVPKHSDQELSKTQNEGSEQVPDSIFQLTINLPHEPHKFQITVSTQEQVQDIRQTIVEFPDTFQYSCFHLEHVGRPVNDFIELSDVEGFTTESELTLVEDPYTEKDARMHVIRLRELLGAAGDRTDSLLGISAGFSIHDHVATHGVPSAVSMINGKSATSVDAPAAHPMKDYDFDTPGSFTTLLSPLANKQGPKTVKAISVSPWNPPPYNLRLRGHLLYLQVTTNEGEQYQITSSVSGFFVNKCSNNKFDPFPRPAPKDFAAHSLLTLISSFSPSFTSAFTALQEFSNLKDPLATFQLTNAIPASPWLVDASAASLASHQTDLTRTQESYLLAGLENADTLRDWNEEFQSTRELPRDTVQERVFRERLTSKLFADYNDAAARGAVLVARGEIAPLNPTEGRDAQIFVYNNIFFSYGADGVSTFASEGGDEAARVATGKDVVGVRAVNQLDIPGLFTPGTVVVDYLGKRLVGQSIVPGIFKQREPGEHQIDYGGVEGRDIVATNAAFAAPFETLSKAMKVKKHSVWDKEGQKHLLEGSVETKGLLGTDARKYVLDLYRITPLDIDWLEKHWSDIPSVSDSDVGDVTEVKGQAPRYPHRMAVLRPELVDAFWKSKMRDFVGSELERRNRSQSEEEPVKAESVEQQQQEEDESKKVDDDVEPPLPTIAQSDTATADGSEQQKLEESVSKYGPIDFTNFQFALNPDVFNGQLPQTEEEKEEWAQDERDVRAACDFLLSKIMPDLISDLKEGDVGFPMDGDSLSRLLHKRGINIRYLGRIASLAREQEPRLEALRELAEQEMLSRAFKHVVNRYLRYLPVPFAPSCVAHLLNCLIGGQMNSEPVAVVDDSLRQLYPAADLGFQKVTVASLRSEIEAQIHLRYNFTLREKWPAEIKPMQLLREVSLKLGLQILARDYPLITAGALHSNGDLAAAASSQDDATVNGEVKAAATNGHSGGHEKKKKKKGTADRNGSQERTEPVLSQDVFQPEDIINIVPIIKDASPKSTLAEEALEAGRISIAQNQKELGQELLLESLSLHEQIYGILHPEVARVYSQLSMLYYRIEEKNAAVELARKAVIVSERTLGVDAAETVLSYLNLGLFEHANGNTQLALTYIRHALEVWKVIYGPHHPDSITTINNAAVMLQHLRRYHESRIWFEASLKVSVAVFGMKSPNTATLLYQLAQALALDQDSKGAVKCMRDAYNIYLAILGPDDKNTKEAENWLEQLTQNAVSIAKHAKDLQARKLRRVPLTPGVTLGTRPQPQVGQSTSDVANGAELRRRTGLDSRSIDELMKFIEGGGDPLKRPTSKKTPGRVNPRRRGGSVIGGGASTQRETSTTPRAV